MTPLSNKSCLECGIAIKGRMDKKFCCDHCRSCYNNRSRADHSDCVRRINNILVKNRKILRELCSREKYRISTEILKLHGFDFEHFTSLKVKKNGQCCYYCYDHGYLAVDEDTLMLVSQPH
jgi:hypothetical protein